MTNELVTLFLLLWGFTRVGCNLQAHRELLRLSPGLGHAQAI